jgi:hypothetical protein
VRAGTKPAHGDRATARPTRGDGPPAKAARGAARAKPDEVEEKPLPTISEQVAQQLGGVRGTIEASIPVGVFVLANIIWSLKPALVIAVVTAIGIAGYRLSQRQSVRHAINGFGGIAVGALVAWHTGKATDFYLPGILITLAYGVAMLISVAVGFPLVGWLWSVVADQGGTRWRDLAELRRTFGRLTMLWAATYLLRAGLNIWIYKASWLTEDQKASVLGIMRITLSFPSYLALLALTVWAVRRHLPSLAKAAPAVAGSASELTD